MTAKNKLFKRVCSGALAVCLIAALSACGTKENSSVKLDPKTPVTISIWNYYNGPQKIAFDGLVKEFNETVGEDQGIVVEAFGEGSIEELTAKVMASAEKKVGAAEFPDVFAAYPDTAYQVDQMGLVTELNQYLTKEEINSYKSEYWQEGVWGDSDSFKIFPIAKSIEIFMLNKTDWDKFAADTGATTDALSTAEGVTLTAAQYYQWSDAQTPDTPDDGKAFFGRDALANYIIIGYRQLGKELFEVKDGKPVLNLDETITRKLWDNYYVPFIQGHFAAKGKFRSDDIKTGSIIALVGSTSGAAYFPDSVMINDIDSYPIETLALPLPVFEGGDKVNAQQGAGMIVSKSTKEREYASVQFLKWFTEPERNLDFSLDSGYLPVTVEATQSDMLEKSVDRIGEENIAKNLLASFPVAAQMLNEYTLYTTTAFNNGSNARYGVQDAINDKCQQDLEQIDALVSSGTSRQDAVAQFNTDENFSSWYQDLKNTLGKFF